MIDVGDIERSIASAEICSIGAEIARRRWPERESGISTAQELKLLRSRCGLLRRSKNQRGNAPARSNGAKFDVGDIDWIIASAGICSIDAGNSAPALAGARIEQFLPRRSWNLLRSHCGSLRRSNNQREIAPARSSGATFDAGDIDWIIGRAKFNTAGAARSSGGFVLGYGAKAGFLPSLFCVGRNMLILNHMRVTEPRSSSSDERAWIG